MKATEARALTEEGQKVDMIAIYDEIKARASELWEKDIKKIEIAKKNGYKVITIWESDMSKLDEKKLDYLVIDSLSLSHD